MWEYWRSCFENANSGVWNGEGGQVGVALQYYGVETLPKLFLKVQIQGVGMVEWSQVVVAFQYYCGVVKPTKAKALAISCDLGEKNTTAFW